MVLLGRYTQCALPQDYERKLYNKHGKRVDGGVEMYLYETKSEIYYVDGDKTIVYAAGVVVWRFSRKCVIVKRNGRLVGGCLLGGFCAEILSGILVAWKSDKNVSSWFFIE